MSKLNRIFVVDENKPLIVKGRRKIKPNYTIVVFTYINSYDHPFFDKDGKSVFHNGIEKIVFKSVKITHSFVFGNKTCFPSNLKKIIFSNHFRDDLIVDHVRILPDGVETVILPDKYDRPIIINNKSIFPNSVKKIEYKYLMTEIDMAEEITAKRLNIDMQHIKRVIRHNHMDSIDTEDGTKRYHNHEYPFKYNGVFGLPENLEILKYVGNIKIRSKFCGIPKTLKRLNMCSVTTDLYKLYFCKELRKLKLFGRIPSLYTENAKYNYRLLPDGLKELVLYPQKNKNIFVMNNVQLLPDSIEKLVIYDDDIILSHLPRSLKKLSIYQLADVSLFDKTTYKCCLPEGIQIVNIHSLEKTLEDLDNNNIPYRDFLPKSLKKMKVSKFGCPSPTHNYLCKTNRTDSILPEGLVYFWFNDDCNCNYDLNSDHDNNEHKKYCINNNKNYQIFPKTLKKLHQYYWPSDIDGYENTYYELVEENKFYHTLHDNLPLPIAEEIFFHISEKINVEVFVCGEYYYSYVNEYPYDPITNDLKVMNDRKERRLKEIYENHDQ